MVVFVVVLIDMFCIFFGFVIWFGWLYWFNFNVVWEFLKLWFEVLIVIICVIGIFVVIFKCGVVICVMFKFVVMVICLVDCSVLIFDLNFRKLLMMGINKLIYECFLEVVKICLNI